MIVLRIARQDRVSVLETLRRIVPLLERETLDKHLWPWTNRVSGYAVRTRKRLTTARSGVRRVGREFELR